MSVHSHVCSLPGARYDVSQQAAATNGTQMSSLRQPRANAEKTAPPATQLHCPSGQHLPADNGHVRYAAPTGQLGSAGQSTSEQSRAPVRTTTVSLVTPPALFCAVTAMLYLGL